MLYSLWKTFLSSESVRNTTEIQLVTKGTFHSFVPKMKGKTGVVTTTHRAQAPYATITVQHTAAALKCFTTRCQNRPHYAPAVLFGRMRTQTHYSASLLASDSKDEQGM